MVTTMDDLEDRRTRLARVLAYSDELTARTEELLSRPRPEYVQEWQPRQAKPEPEVRNSRASVPGGIDIYERIDRVWQHHLRDRAAISDVLDALADEAGAATGKLQKQVNELKAQVEEMRGEIALLRATSQRASRRKTISRAPFMDMSDEHIPH
jgi:hypothetical protein